MYVLNRLLKSTLLCLLIFVAFQALPLKAQILYESIYRPKNLDWQQLKSPHFTVVFPRGYEFQAQRTAYILESELSKTNHLTGGKLEHIPVVLNTWNDLSNGYVTPFHFRIEVEMPPILGKSLNQANGDWLTNVMPHELVHASHGAVKPKGSLYGLLNLFSPDLYRATNFSAPSGHIEGIAVHHESDSVVVGTGRGNYADFINQYHAVHQEKPWSMGQLYFPSQRTQPFNRHYIGGYAFSQWLIDEYGSEVIGKTHETLIRWPFLGFGFALRKNTGKWPNELYQAYQKSALNRKDAQPPVSAPLISSTDGAFERRPQWLNDSTLVYFGRYYNEVGGLFTANLSTGKHQLLSETRISNDYRYFIDRKSKKIYLGSELIHPILDDTFVSTLIEVDATTGKRKKANAPKRVYSPELADTNKWLIQRFADRSKLLLVDEKGDVLKSFSDPSMHWIALRVHPKDPNKIAVIAQYYGQQALWITQINELSTLQNTAPTLYFAGHSIFDPEWHPDGNQLLFSSDHTGTRQLYILEVDSNTPKYSFITNEPYGAFEGAFSPDASRIAYVSLRGNEYTISTIEFEKNTSLKDFISYSFDTNTWKDTYLYQPNTVDTTYQITKYRSGLSWLKPRSILPLDEDDGFGFSIASNDLLRGWSYQSDISFFDSEIWHDTRLTYKGRYPGLEARWQSFPVQLGSGINVFDANRELAGQLFTDINRQRVDLNLHFQYTPAGNRRTSFLLVEPGYRYDQATFYQLNFEPAQPNIRGDFSALYNDRYAKHAVFSRALAGIGYVQTPRDLMPRSGWLIESEAVYDFRLINDGALTGLFRKGNALMLGLNRFVNLWPAKNQQLRLSAHRYWQRNSLFFDAESIIHPALEGTDLVNSFGIIPADILSLRTKWTIPIAFPENGWVTLPAYISTLYLSLNHNTVFNMDNSNADPLHLFGGGLRAQIQFARISMDFGVGYFIDSNGDNRVYVGNF
jgi:hypothetical protein